MILTDCVNRLFLHFSGSMISVQHPGLNVFAGQTHPILRQVAQPASVSCSTWL